MSTELLIFESLKLAAQLVGALFIAWLTVQWALGRYKREKTWERRLGAYADLITAMSELVRLNRTLFADEIASRQIFDQDAKARLERYQAARLKVEEAFSVGLLLLPDDALNVLSKFQVNWLNEAFRHDVQEDIEASAEALKECLAGLIKLGRNDLL